MKPESFLRGAVVLTVAGIVVKLLGAVYRIPFTRIVGSEGIGLYQMAYPVYTALLALSTAGIPVALSFLVAEKSAAGDRQGARQVFAVSLIFLVFLGGFLALGLYLLSPYLAERVLGDSRAYYSLLAVSPAIFVISVAAAFRGYFQGWRMMWPTAISEVVEQTVRVGTVLLAAQALMPRGVEFAAAGAASGAFTGGCAGLAFLILVFLWFKRQRRPVGGLRRERPLRFDGQATRHLKRLVAYAFPISAGSLVLPLTQVIDTVIIPNRLQAAGYSIQSATSQFGQLSGMAGTVVYLPAALTVSIAMALVPHLASAVSRNDRSEVNRRVSTALRVTFILCLPAAAGLMLLAAPIMELLFDDAGAGAVTAWLAPAALFTGLQQTTAGALQGIGNTWLPVVNLLVGCLVKIFCNYYLTVIPGFGIKGAALGSALGFLLVFLLNLFCLTRLTDYRPRISRLIRPLLAVTMMVIVIPAVCGALAPLGNLPATGLTILCGAFCYFAVLLATGEIRVYEMRYFFRK
mgnify:CR=1 FL=1|jgi:stage V sporulation protein B